MSAHPAVIVHTRDAALAKGLATDLDGVTLLHTVAGDDLGRLLTSDHEVVVLVAHLQAATGAERGWQRISVIRAQLPALPILAYLDADVAGWDPAAGTCPASAIVRGPTSTGELARAIRVAGRLAVAPGRADDEAPAPTSRSRAVVGLAGGVGATTIATLLGARLALEQPTILVDLDQRHGALAGTLRVAPRYTTYDLAGAFDAPDRLDEAMPAVLTPVRENLRLLAARDEPDIVVARSGTGDASTVRELLRACNRTGAQVVVDVGDLPLAMYPVLAEVAEVVIVVAQDIRCVRRLPIALAHLQDRAPSVVTRIVLNRSVSNLEPSPRQLSALVRRPWDVVLAELPAIHVAQNEVDHDGLLTLSSAPPRAIDVLTSTLLDLAPPSRIGRKARRANGRSPAGSSPGRQLVGGGSS